MKNTDKKILMKNENDLTFYQQETGASVHTTYFHFFLPKKIYFYFTKEERVQNKYEKIHIKHYSFV